MSWNRHPAVERICSEYGEETLDVLAERLSGADLTALLLEVAQRRTSALTPADVVRQRERDRFVRPASVDGRRMIETEHRAIDSIGDAFDVLTLSPVCPIGTHSVIAGVHQHRVVTTFRGSEVAADPTNGLALEAALRRRDYLRSSPRSADTVNLACVQRVTRAQQFDGPMSFAHFSLLGVVIAGRDTGNFAFERTAFPRLLSSMARVVRDAGADDVVVAMTDFDGRLGQLVQDVADELAGIGVHSIIDSERTAGRGYYQSVCFKVHATFDDEEVEVGDGGFVPWTQGLLSNAKERLLIGGIGLDRLALATSSAIRSD